MMYPWRTVEHTVNPVSRKLRRNAVLLVLQKLVDGLPDVAERLSWSTRRNGAFQGLASDAHKVLSGLVNVANEECLGGVAVVAV